jgi:hypothetical protein
MSLYFNLQIMKLVLSFIFMCLVLTAVQAQTSDDKYQRPLADVLTDIQKQFNVRLKIPAGMVDGKVLDYADWRIRPYSLEQTLQNVLAPFDLIFVKEFENVYKIKTYEYSRRLPEVGADYLKYFSEIYSDLPSWEARKAQLKQCMREALRIDSLPKMQTVNVIKANRRVLNGYTVENFAMETLPGLYVCGSMYMPVKFKGKLAAILCPNGHFTDGRYRADQQYRCAMLAKMGAVVVSYDLFAWGESLLQFKEADHRRAVAQSVQTLNSIRILDYLLTLKNVDANRVGITGGSGGGTQTVLLTAIDDRLKVSAPVVSVSSYFAGGCPCESGLPVHLCGGGTNNAEIAAMAAPRPQLLVTDGKDWSQHVPELEYPFIKRTYGFYGAEVMVENAHFPDEGHDYGRSKRMAVYPFFAKHLGLDIKRIQNANGDIDESTIVIEPKEALLVFGKNGEKLPANAIKSVGELEQIVFKR